MNGDVKGSCEDLASTTQDKGTENEMDTKLCHTIALTTNHCDNSNNCKENQENSESTDQPDDIIMKNNTDQSDLTNIDSKDLSIKCEEVLSNEDVMDIPLNESKSPSDGGNQQAGGDCEQRSEAVRDALRHLLKDDSDQNSSESQQLLKTESDQNSSESISKQQSVDDDSNLQSVNEVSNEKQNNSTNNDVVGKGKAVEVSTKNATYNKNKPENRRSFSCKIPIITDLGDHYVEMIDDAVSDEDSELDDEDLDDDDSLKAEDAVSINSESDIENIDSSSQDSQNKSDIVIIEHKKKIRNGNSSRNMSSPEIHEITSDIDDDDDCILSEDNISVNNFKNKKKMINHEEQTQNGDNSDIEEVEPINKPKEKTTPATITNSKTINIEKQQKKGDENDLYKAIAARGTTVKPFNPKAGQQNSNTQQQQAILPSLTDDMFVVEAPSFIVPYVYEKPSTKPFREFVDILGREIEEKQQKEEKERLEREKEEKAKKEKERQEKLDRGEPVSEDEVESKTITPKKDQKKGRSRRRNVEEDDVSWDGSSSSDSEEEGLSDDNKEDIKDKDDSIEEIKTVVASLNDKMITSVPDNYFDCTLGKFFLDIGINLVQEYVQHDLIKTQNRKLNREKKQGHSTKALQSSINSLRNNLELSQENNAPYTFEYKKCEFCSFRTESQLIMANHLETPHMRNNLHRCNFCSYEVKGAHDILYHMDIKHGMKGKLERAPAFHQCVNCHFEDSGKGKLARHQIACAKRFKPDFNLAPPMDWEPPAKIPKLTKARNTMDYNAMGRGMNVPIRGNVNQLLPAANLLKNRPRVPVPRNLPTLTRAPNVLRANSLIPGNAVGLQTGKVTAGGSKPASQSSLSITPMPRAPAPIQISAAQQAKGTFVICEICDGYIKDLEQLRNHMQWIHKVKIHPKMICNRPPLNCQKCQFRFFTDQGLERHLLGAHGLVTSSMQESANKGKDSGRCPVCGKVYQWKLLNHVARDHSLTLKPAHLSYKCTVCSATFGMYKLFENHVYSAHRVVAKKAADKAPPAKETMPKPVKMNDEITIIPQPTGAVKRKIKE